jgi:type II secretory pathway component GspD/PulD (secretin)
MNTFNRPALSLVFALGGVVAISLAPRMAQGQVVQNNIGAPFVQPQGEAFEIGPVLDVIPYVLSDGFTVNLTMIPTLNEFVGYDNPNEVLTSGVTLPTGAILVPTVLPRFRVRQVHSTVNVWDGQTVVLGGLVSDNVTSVKDKVPILGDLPFVGRLFRSEAKNTQKKNLVIFVTPTIIDPAGNRMHSEEEMPFAQTTFPTQPKSPNGANGVLVAPPTATVPAPAPVIVSPPVPPAPAPVVPPPVVEEPAPKPPQ